MLVKDFLHMLGYEMMHVSYRIHWDYNEEEKIIVSEHISAIHELFGLWMIAVEDSIYLSCDKDYNIIMDLYIYKPENKN